ncbi:uncharacterized protein LOC132715679 isoform X2 [Ruditapes philippinarum]|uniref:uncharacterized protein LOC132715679 isoform X2 n=1 Tax=Ruditapes philippinarum TaxID=129788 RepID=UPI00295A8AC5|nr:uncharacterized protein LOC132715679 isoform X2 [Ruditapes philippinarum]
MAGSGEPPLKKYKTSKESIFERYWDKTDAVEALKELLKSLKTPSAYCFGLLKILTCNAHNGFPFSQAYCETKTNAKEISAGVSSIDVYLFSTVFKRGYEMVLNYTIDKNNVPSTRGERVALERLLRVLDNVTDIEEALKNAKSQKEVDWTITLAHHLLRQLAVNQTYIVDKQYHGRIKWQRCPCCEQPITGRYADTSIGYPSVWHGDLDLILGSEVPITVAEEEDEEICEGNKSSFEVKLSHEFPAKYRDQLIAQTIVFSFLEKKEKTTYENYLIPSIGIAKDQFVIFLYDSEHDILLESKVIKLWAPTGRLYQSALLALWLGINYSLTCSGVTEHMKSCGFTSDFPKHGL